MRTVLAAVGAAGMLLLAGAPAAHGQAPLPPTLALDGAFAPPTGVARDGAPGTATDNPFATAVDGNRIYVVGESANDVAIVARRIDGTLDPGFSEDGKLTLALGSNRDAGVDVVVLPDRRLRILALKTSQTNTSDTDVVVLGLLPDGSDDLDFGGGDGRVAFPVGPRRDTPSRLAVDATGRLAIAGWAEDGAAKEDAFLALLRPDGTPVESFDGDGIRLLARAEGTLDDRAVDVVFRPGGGLVTALQVATNADRAVDDFVAVLHGVTEEGADDPAFSEDGDLVLAPGAPNTVPGALIEHGGRLWLTGSTVVGSDVDAFLLRVNADGSGLESRRYDVRGERVAATEAVVTAGRDLAVLPGTPDTLVVVGATGYLSRTYWSAIAFNGLDGPLDRLGSGELLVATDEIASLVGVAAGPGWLAVTGTLRDQSTFDTSFGSARLFVDAEKRCDLALDLLGPLELVFAGSDPDVALRVTNVGTRACAGTLSVPAPYTLGAPSGSPVPTGTLAPGASMTTSGARVTYRGPRRRDDVVAFTVSGAGDVNPRNDARSLGVVFSFCDLVLQPFGGAGLVPSEGSRSFAFTLRNGGTSPCRRARLGAAAGARAAGDTPPFTLAAGRSGTVELRAAITSRTAPGTLVPLRFRAAADGDVDAANDDVTIRPLLVGVGDTTLTATGARTVRGRATPGTAGKAKLAASRLAVDRVDVALQRLGRGCRWVASARTLALRTVKVAKGRPCGSPTWLRARGTRAWRLSLFERLPRGRYVALSRAIIGAGFPEAAFTTKDRNRVAFTVR